MKRNLIVILAVLICIYLSGCKSNDYDAAIDAMSVGHYAEAARLFESLGDYKESINYAMECNYRNALDLMNTQRNYESAYNIFRALGDYIDAPELAAKCQKMMTPIYALIEYVDANATYIANLGTNGYLIDQRSDLTVALVSNNDKLEIRIDAGTPVVNWKSMDIFEFATYRNYFQPDRIEGFIMGDCFFNHLEVNMTMDPETQMATFKMDYISLDDDRLSMGVGSSSFDYAQYRGDHSWYSEDGFNQLHEEDKANTVILTLVEYLSRMMKESGLNYSVQDLGWKSIG